MNNIKLINCWKGGKLPQLYIVCSANGMEGTKKSTCYFCLTSVYSFTNCKNIVHEKLMAIRDVLLPFHHIKLVLTEITLILIVKIRYFALFLYKYSSDFYEIFKVSIVQRVTNFLPRSFFFISNSFFHTYFLNI